MFDQIGIGALHNTTDIPFLTSDNPIIWFDPSVAEAEIQPYRLQVGGPIVLLFPVTPNLMIYGHTSMRERFTCDGFGDGDLSEPNAVQMMNRQLCRFSYNTVFAQTAGQEDLIRDHADLSPVLKTETFAVGKEEFV